MRKLAVGIITCLLGIMATTPTMAESLVESAYPDSFAWPQKGKNSAAHTRTFSSRASPQTVINFYRNRVGSSVRTPGCEFFFEVMSRKKVSKILKKHRDSRAAQPVGVCVSTQKGAKGYGSGFELTKKLGELDRSPDEADAMAKKYRHLETSFSPPESVVGVSESDEPANDAITRRCQKEIDTARLTSKIPDMSTKIRQAVQRGDMAEAERLEQLSQSGVRSGNAWDTTIDCLRQLDKYAYQTLIRIHTHPSTWP